VARLAANLIQLAHLAAKSYGSQIRRADKLVGVAAAPLEAVLIAGELD
jgi:hypothetical protein